MTRADVGDGGRCHTVAAAVGKHPTDFVDRYDNIGAAGEAGGIVDTILMRLATVVDKNDALVRKVKGAMFYPGVIMSVAAIAMPGVSREVPFVAICSSRGEPILLSI